MVAAPLAYLVMNRWLDRFAFHADLGWGLFAAALAGVLTVTFATVAWQSIRAARVNPVASLRAD